MEYYLALLSDPTAWVALGTLVVLEIVLGIDNLIFISILTNKLPKHLRSNARRIGIGFALFARLALLATVAFIVKLADPIIVIFEHSFSWRDLILIAGGLFLVWKATMEIHHKVDPAPSPKMLNPAIPATNVAATIGQILLLDIIFSIDSIITAVGMTEHLPIMYIAVIAAVATMLLAADPLADFISANPTVVMLALGFLFMIGTVLIADGFGAHIPRGYIYAALTFSASIEGLNILSSRARKKRLQEAQAEFEQF